MLYSEKDCSNRVRKKEEKNINNSIAPQSIEKFQKPLPSTAVPIFPIYIFSVDRSE
jgi:hypothetical protein